MPASDRWCCVKRIAPNTVSALDGTSPRTGHSRSIRYWPISTPAHGTDESRRTRNRYAGRLKRPNPQVLTIPPVIPEPLTNNQTRTVFHRLLQQAQTTGALCPMGVGLSDAMTSAINDVAKEYPNVNDSTVFDATLVLKRELQS